MYHPIPKEKKDAWFQNYCEQMKTEKSSATAWLALTESSEAAKRQSICWNLFSLTNLQKSTSERSDFKIKKASKIWKPLKYFA